MKKSNLIILVLAIVAVVAYFGTKTDNKTASSTGGAKIGVLLGFTGPIESLTPTMGASAELAIKEVSESGAFFAGTVSSVRGDSTCVDAAAATSAAENLVTSEKVNAIVGAACSGASGAVLKNVSVPKGVVQISPSSTSPGLTSAKDNGLFFRTAPSDARQGEVIAQIMKEQGIKTAALTYTNNDYGKGLADSIASNFKKVGGKITISAPHEDGKGDYSAEVASLAAAGGEVLIVAGYLDQGGKGIIQASLDSDAFNRFVLPDGMIGDSLTAAIGKGLNGSIGVRPGSTSGSSDKFTAYAGKNDIKSGPYANESYDAAAIILLAMQAAKSTDSNVFKSKVMEVTNAPGVKIGVGELAKALKLLAEGKDINYQGASDVEFVEPGESAGSFLELKVSGGKFETVGAR